MKLALFTLVIFGLAGYLGIKQRDEQINSCLSKGGVPLSNGRYCVKPGSVINL